MSKTIEAKITCPNCQHQFDFVLFRSIWGEYPENRELVMADKINVAECPSCRRATKLVFALMYTNAKQKFAVWWEPKHDAQIDRDTAGYIQMLGEGNYLAAAPRIQNWDEFKSAIIQFENDRIKGNAGEPSREMDDHLQGFTKSIENENKKRTMDVWEYGHFFLLLQV